MTYHAGALPEEILLSSTELRNALFDSLKVGTGQAARVPPLQVCTYCLARCALPCFDAVYEEWNKMLCY